jgi:hypothetical protein
MQVNSQFSFELLPSEVQDLILQYLTVDQKNVGSLLCVSKTVKVLFIARLTIDNNQFANSYLQDHNQKPISLQDFNDVANRTRTTLSIIKTSGQLVPDDTVLYQKMMRCLSKASGDMTMQAIEANRRIRELARIQI